jgi:hypothetical protein
LRFKSTLFLLWLWLLILTPVVIQVLKAKAVGVVTATAFYVNQKNGGVGLNKLKLLNYE